MADHESARASQASAEQVLRAEKDAHREAAATWSTEHQEIRVELATLRERAAAAEQQREIARFQEEQATTLAALRLVEVARTQGHIAADQSLRAARAARGKQPSK